MYNKSSNTPSVQVAMTEEQEEEEEKTLLKDDDLINVEGTRIRLSKNLVEHAENVKRKALVLKFPKQAVKTEKKRRLGSVIHCDYLKKPKQTSNRRRTDPVVTMSSIFENILNEMRDLPNTQPFLFPVSAKEVPDYYRVIEKPMDLQTIRDGLRNKKYRSREEFLVDVNQVVENCRLYNGVKSALTLTAQGMMDLCLKRFAEKEDKLMRLEKAINPLLDDNDQVAFSFILDNIVVQMKAVENSWPFHQPVNKKFVKDYYEVIKHPMDLSTLQKKVQSHKYQTREQFLDDVELLYHNSRRYNGPDSAFTATALKMLELGRSLLFENEEHLVQLENEIRAAQEAALDAVETDSIMTGTSANPEDSLLGMDSESVDEAYSMSRENITIAEDGDEDSKSWFNESKISNNISYSDSEFVDVEGDDDNAVDMNYSQQQESTQNTSDQISFNVSSSAGGENEDELARDLQITPEASDNEAKLSDSENEDNGEVQQPQNYEQNGQQFYDGGTSQVYYESQEPYQVAAVQEEDENSFDPSDFFMHSALASEAVKQEHMEEQGVQEPAPMETDINNDLQVSESDESDNEAKQGNNSDDGFDIDEFFK